ncbi:MaoC family dehydratase N-terminal domain-containing protein [Streptomyces sp. A3M-1-3]|uniref:FAS1-like dehydratase domain-containing protein n=1 Tax=Streptomyces sp. A3M-1-3 TaxID=2962044 RepID=UPI0020B812AD|nr:MaoC family dehydratase N-terminal domain-containing protein [Streptomyces sp. A3M-1-3]MCP3821619.1 MaoC family dehydratase N-terminal domain-containing protein [Streptomyces sp. A3M-1-3]
MPVNPELVGTTLSSEEPYEATRGDIRAFAAVVDDHNPLYRDPAAARALGYADVIAPPTFAVTVSGMVTRRILRDPALGLGGRQVIHESQKLFQHRPIVAGDRLTTTAVLRSAASVGGYERLTLHSEIRDAHDTEVYTVVTVVLAPA